LFEEIHPHSLLISFERLCGGEISFSAQSFSSAKSSAFGGDFAACFSIALSLDAGTYSFVYLQFPRTVFSLHSKDYAEEKTQKSLYWKSMF
jgi:hypothetical protein